MFKRTIALFLCLLIVGVGIVNGGAITFNASAEECEHEFSDWSVTSPANCTEPGVEYKLCNLCGETVTTVIEPALGHLFGEWGTSKEATCAQAGELARVCERCNETETCETEKLPHNFVDGRCSGCNALLGDGNSDNVLDIRDLVIMKEFLLNSPEAYDALLDMDINGTLSADDIVILRKTLFAGF